MRRTLEPLGLHSRGRALRAVVLGAGAIAVLGFVIPGGDEQVSDELRWALAVLIPIALYTVPMFIYNLGWVSGQRQEVRAARGVSTTTSNDPIEQVIAGISGKAVAGYGTLDTILGDHGRVLVGGFTLGTVAGNIFTNTEGDTGRFNAAGALIRELQFHLLVDDGVPPPPGRLSFAIQSTEYHLTDLGRRVVNRLASA